MVSESGEIIGRLVSSGLNMEQIGQAVGRNRSLVRQIMIGRKPGNNLRDALAQLEGALAGQPAPAEVIRETRVAKPAPRTTKAGKTARVRRPTTIRGRGWQTSTVRRQAARHGAHGMAHPIRDAAADGRDVAVTASFTKGVKVNADYGRRGRAGWGGTVEMNLGDAEQVQAEVDDMYGGDFAAYVLDQAAARGHIDNPEAARRGLEAIELRAF